MLDNHEELIKEYQSIKDKVAKIESDKIKTQTELDLKEKELASVVEELKSLGITDLDNVDKVVEERRNRFEEELKSLGDKLVDVQ